MCIITQECILATCWCPACIAWVLFAIMSSYCKHLCLFLKLFSGLLEGHTEDVRQLYSREWPSTFGRVELVDYNPRFVSLGGMTLGHILNHLLKVPSPVETKMSPVVLSSLISLALTYCSHLLHSHCILLTLSVIPSRRNTQFKIFVARSAQGESNLRHMCTHIHTALTHLQSYK